MEDFNVAWEEKRAFAVVAIFKLGFFQENLKERMIYVLSFDHKPLFLRSDVDGEAAFRRYPLLLSPVLVFRGGCSCGGDDDGGGGGDARP